MTPGRRPVSARTCSIMCSVPPGPSPDLPSQSAIYDTLRKPLDSAEYQHPAITALVDVYIFRRRPDLVRHNAEQHLGPVLEGVEVALPVFGGV